MKTKLFFLLPLLATSPFVIAQIKIGYVNKGTVANDKVEIYNDNLLPQFENKVLKIWIGNNSLTSEYIYVSNGEIGTFRYSLTPSNYSNSYIFYTYDAECFGFDTTKISNRVAWGDLLDGFIPCDKDDPKFIPCLREEIRKKINEGFAPDAIAVIEDLEKILTEDKINISDKKTVLAAYFFCVRLYMAKQSKEVVSVGNMVNLYLSHITFKQKIGTQVAAQRTPKLSIEGGFFNSTYKFENYDSSLSYSSWNKFPTYTIRLYKYYDFKKTETHKWPVFYISTGFMHGPLTYRNKPDTLFKGNGFSYNYIDLKGGWYASANYDPKIFFSVFLEAGVQACFRNDYTVNTNGSTLVSFKSTRKFSFESVKLSVSAGLVLGISPFIFRCSYDRSGSQDWFSDKKNNFDLKNTSAMTVAVSFPIKNMVRFRYRW